MDSHDQHSSLYDRNESNMVHAVTMPRRRSQRLMSYLPSVQAMHSVGGATLARKRLAEQRTHLRSFSATVPLDETYLDSGPSQIQPTGQASDAVLLESGLNLPVVAPKSYLEEFSFDDLSSLKELHINMKKKKEIRSKLLEDQERKGAKIKISSQSKMNWRKMKEDITDVLHQVELWQSSIHEIEGRFGTGIRTYFAFLRRLFSLNFYIFLLVFLFIVLPTVIFDNLPNSESISSDSASRNLSEQCIYDPYDPNSLNSFSQYVIWWFTGQGFLENTLLFCGYYDNVVTNATAAVGFQFYYDLPLAYLLVAFFYLLLSLVLIVRRAAVGLKQSLVTDDQLYSYCNLVFGGWDYCITDEKAASLKQKSLKYELQTDLEEERIRKRQQNRTRNQKIKLYIKRFAVNIFVISVILASLVTVYFAAIYSLENKARYVDNFLLDLIVTYLTSIVITIVNFIAPFLFEFIVIFEDYSPEFAIRFTLIRIVFLRLASLVFLYVVVFLQINCGCEDSSLDFSDLTGLSCVEDCGFCSDIKCWETYIGQEMYKLTLLDFFAVVGMTLLIEFPRKLMVDRCSCGLSQWLGQQEFSIPTNVLDIVYAQTIGWIGAFYAPLLPVMLVIKFFIYFYLKKLTLVYNCRPSTRPYRASKFGSFFFIMLIFGLGVSILPVVVSVAIQKPSIDCGPFRGWDSMVDALTFSIQQNLHVWAQDLFWFFGSPSFAAVIIIILCLMLYYYVALGSAHQEMIGVLRNQLTLEGKDKQFLLSRFNSLSEELQQQKQQPGRYPNNNVGRANPAFSGETSGKALPGQTDDISDL